MADETYAQRRERLDGERDLYVARLLDWLAAKSGEPWEVETSERQSELWRALRSKRWPPHTSANLGRYDGSRALHVVEAWFAHDGASVAFRVGEVRFEQSMHARAALPGGRILRALPAAIEYWDRIAMLDRDYRRARARAEGLAHELANTMQGECHYSGAFGLWVASVEAGLHFHVSAVRGEVTVEVQRCHVDEQLALELAQACARGAR